MSQQQWAWYIKNEKEIFDKIKNFFSDTKGNNPLLRNDKVKLFPDAPKTLNYWLGFRIVTKYVEKQGKDSWRDLYALTVKEVLSKSGYEDYIKKTLINMYSYINYKIDIRTHANKIRVHSSQ